MAVEENQGSGNGGPGGRVNGWLILGGICAALVVLAFVLNVVVLKNDLVTPVAPRGLVDLELARGGDYARDIVSAWRMQANSQAPESYLFVDILFVVGYSGLFVIGAILARAAFQQDAWVRDRPLWNRLLTGALPVVLPFVILVTALLENLLLWAQLGKQSDAQAFWIFLLAVGKLTLSVLIGLYLFIAFIRSPERRKAAFVLEVLYWIRFSVAINVLTAIGLLIPGQVLDVFRVLIENGLSWPVFWLWLTTVILSWQGWYWARAILDKVQTEGAVQPEDPAPGQGLRFETWTVRLLPRFCGLAPYLVVLIALFRAAYALDLPHTTAAHVSLSNGERNSLILYGTIFFISGILFYLSVFARRRRIREEAKIPRKHRWIWFSLFTAVILFIAIAGATDQYQNAVVIGPLAVIVFALAAIIPIGSSLVITQKATNIPFISLLLLGAFVLSARNVNDDHEIRHTILPTSQPDGFNGRQFDTTFEKWLDDRIKKEPEYARPGAPPYPVVLVAAEGGGLRAAYQAGIALASLQEDKERRATKFVNHVFAISGVSGGSVGAATFAALAVREEAHPGTVHWVANTQSILHRDLLSPTAAALCYGESLQRFLPVTVHAFDRSVALETSLEKSWSKTFPGEADASNPFKQSLYALSTGFETRAIPGLFLNTTSVETGDRLCITTVPTRQGMLNNLQTLDQVSAPTDLTLSTAAFLSARFTYVSPSGSLRVYRQPELPANRSAAYKREDHLTGWKRYVDGGYFENSGAATLNDVLDALVQVRSNPRLKPFRIIVIRIGFSYDPEKPDMVDKSLEGLDEPLAPVRALFNTRDARARVAVQRLRASIDTLNNSLPGAPAPQSRQSLFVDIEMREETVPLVVSWMLSNKACRSMDTQIGNRTASYRSRATQDLDGALISLKGEISSQLKSNLDMKTGK